MSSRNNGRRNTKRRVKPKRKDQRMVWTKGQGQPQGYPFAPDKRVVKKSIRYSVLRVSSDANGNFLHRFSLRNVQRAFDGTGTYEDALNLSNVYDNYRPMWVRLQMIPVFATATFSVGSIIAAPDYDDNDTSQQVTTNLAANQYSERQVINPRQTSLTTFKVPAISSGTIPGAVTTTPVVIEERGFLDFQAIPFEGVVYLVGSNFPPNLSVYDIYLEMDILLKNAR